MLAPTSPTPEVHGPVGSREDAGGDTYTRTGAGAQQEQPACGQEVFYQRLHPVDTIRGNQALLREDVFELSVVVERELGVVGRFDRHPKPLSLATGCASRLLHGSEHSVERRT